MCLSMYGALPHSYVSGLLKEPIQGSLVSYKDFSSRRCGVTGPFVVACGRKGNNPGGAGRERLNPNNLETTNVKRVRFSLSAMH